jgi:DNA (cytosine-5)-methyltransferase 1
MIKVIDLFAGPGGLGEGFASYIDSNTDKTPFSIVASIEKEASAHKTLLLRSFFRKFPRGEAPKEYYQYVSGDGISRVDLFAKYPAESKAAFHETLEVPRTLGTDNKLIEQKIKEELDGHKGFTIVIGGPPCQAYSLVGRARNQGNVNYDAAKDPRHLLYKEYLRILALVTPEVFVMENVKGILSSKLEGKNIFPQIINDLRNPSEALGLGKDTKYKIYSLVIPSKGTGDPEYEDSKDFIIRAENFGVPQARHRVILLGIKAGINGIPKTLIPVDHVTVEQAIGDLPRQRSGLSKEPDSFDNWQKIVQEIYGDLIEELGNSEMLELSDFVRMLELDYDENLNRGGNFVLNKLKNVEELPISLRNWLLDNRINGVLNHDTRGHIRLDLKRYLYCAIFAKFNKDSENPSPKAKEFPDFLAPNHKNWKTGKFADRFRVQVANKFATTITSHISKDGHYFIHYDPTQCRSLTVREAARIQTFPDNYFFEGTRTEQYVQVGNAVPPFLANQIADIVYDLIQRELGLT